MLGMLCACLSVHPLSILLSVHPNLQLPCVPSLHRVYASGLSLLHHLPLCLSPLNLPSLGSLSWGHPSSLVALASPLFSHHHHHQVNGLKVDLPAEVLTSVSVSRNPDGSVLVRQKAGVQVQFDTTGQLAVIVSDAHAEMLCGICGNFDGNPTNDVHDSNEKTLESWRAQDFSPW